MLQHKPASVPWLLLLIYHFPLPHTPLAAAAAATAGAHADAVCDAWRRSAAAAGRPRPCAPHTVPSGSCQETAGQAQGHPHVHRTLGRCGRVCGVGILVGTGTTRTTGMSWGGGHVLCEVS